MKLLFWNVKKNPVGPILSEIVRRHDVEIVVLAECLNESAILVDLNATSNRLFHLTDSQGTRIVIYTRFSPEYIKTVHSDKFLTIRHIILPEKRHILLAAMHLESKRHRHDIHLWGKASDVSAKIRQVEDELGISRTVLVGDLNMNPFEMGLIQANGLHAVMTKAIARKRGRRSAMKCIRSFTTQCGAGSVTRLKGHRAPTLRQRPPLTSISGILLIRC